MPLTGVQVSLLNPGDQWLKGGKDGYSVASMYFVVAINELPKGVFFVVYVPF